MAKQRTGTSTIIACLQKMNKMQALYGANDLTTRTNSEVAAKVTAVNLAYRAWASQDDYPDERDNTGPIIPGEDGPPQG